MDKNLILLCYLFITHYIADFAIQSRNSAENKSHSFNALMEHITSYYMFSILFIILPMMFVVAINKYPAFYSSLVYYVISMTTAHLVTDYLTSKFNAKMRRDGKVKLFWIGIGFDQMLHTIQIIYFFNLFIFGA